MRLCNHSSLDLLSLPYRRFTAENTYSMKYGRPSNKAYLVNMTHLQSEEEAAAKKLRNQAGTLLIVIGTTILVSYTPILSIAMLAAFHYNVSVGTTG